MTYVYKLKQLIKTAHPPPKLHQATKPVMGGCTIQCEDGCWYHVVSIQQNGGIPQLNVGPDGMTEHEAVLLAQQLGLIP